MDQRDDAPAGLSAVAGLISGTVAEGAGCEDVHGSPKGLWSGRSRRSYRFDGLARIELQVLVAMEGEQTVCVKTIFDNRDGLAKQQRNAKIPLRVLALPRERLI